MNTAKILSSVALVSLVALSAPPAAAASEVSVHIRQEVNGVVREVRQELKDLRQDIKGVATEKVGSRPGLLKKFFELRAAIGSGKITAKTADSLTIESDGKTYAVLIDTKTQLRRRFFGKSSLSEMQIGDSVNVVGRWEDDAHTTVRAILIRDLSIQLRFGIFIGVIQAITGNQWSVQTEGRGTQTVTVSGSTAFTNRKGETITQADVQVGNRVRIRGLWNRALNTITEVTKVKDFSLPPRPTAAITVTPTPTATPTPAPQTGVRSEIAISGAASLGF